MHHLTDHYKIYSQYFEKFEVLFIPTENIIIALTPVNFWYTLLKKRRTITA